MAKFELAMHQPEQTLFHVKNQPRGDCACPRGVGFTPNAVIWRLYRRAGKFDFHLLSDVCGDFNRNQ